ncbi:MAG: 4Fe-4S ferredoxin, partial [Gammaproteobacteria bacterium]
AKQKNRQWIDKLNCTEHLQVLFSSQVTMIEKERVTIRQQKEISYPNQAVIICAGGILPTGLLKSIGVTVDTKYGDE